MVKADVICHYLEHRTRESYAAEKANAAADPGNKPMNPVPGWAQFRQGASD